MSSFAPLLEIMRGEALDALHYGAVAIVDTKGKLVAWYGDPQLVVYLRSSAKPFQVLPFLADGGQAYYGLTEREIALMCASHSGTDEHVALVQAIQGKTGVRESDLLCGVHFPLDEATAEALKARGEQPTPNQHNCSGKHTGMLAFAGMLKKSGIGSPASQPYIDPQNPVQIRILETFARMCDIPVEQVTVGVDGCSAPIFAVSLQHAARAFARLCDPTQSNVEPPELAEACQAVTSAMAAYPGIVGGPGRFDTRLMEATHGRLIAKGGAEGYQGIGLLPGALGHNSPAFGIALKVADGDARRKVTSATALEVLQQLGALSSDELSALSNFSPCFPVHNWRKVVVGQARPVFQLNFGE